MYCRTRVDGVINNPSVAATGWTIEVALPFSKLAVNESVTVPPKSGDMWRINFSRVEWAVKVRYLYVKATFYRSDA
jgi:hypothetical protein